MKLTPEQKKARAEFAEISRKLDKERGKDKTAYHKINGESGYRTYVIFDGTEISEGGWPLGRKWMTAKFMNHIVDKWVAQSYSTRVDTLYKKGLLPKDFIEPLRQQGMLEYTAGDGQCGGCRWYADIDGDYGFCFNQDSPNEGRITFEHGGCIQHHFIQQLLNSDDNK